MSTLAGFELDVEKTLRERIEARRTARLGEFDDASLAWLVIVPLWTERLAASACFPVAQGNAQVVSQVDSTALADFLERAEAAGVCARETRAAESVAARRNAEAMMALWPRLSEADKRKRVDDLRECAQAMAPGALQKRVLREAQSYLSGAPQSSSAIASVATAIRTIFTADSAAPDPEATRRAAQLLEQQLSETAKTGSSVIESATVRLAAVSDPQGAQIVPAALDAISTIQDPKARVRAATVLQTGYADDATLERYIIKSASSIDVPEDRAQALLQAATPASGGPRLDIWNAALGALRDIAEPESRAAALLNVAPGLVPALRAQVNGLFDDAVSKVANPELRARMLASALAWLTREKAAKAVSNVIALAGAITEAGERASVLAAAARALAKIGKVDEALALANDHDDPVARAQILLETYASKPVVGLAEAMEPLNARERERVLCTLSPAAAQAAAKSDPALVSEVAREAAQRGRLVAAARIAALLTARRASPIFAYLVEELRRLPNHSDRLAAICEVGAYLPSNAALAIWPLARGVDAARGFWLSEPLREDVTAYLQSRRGPTFFDEAARTSARAILACAARGDDVPTATARWAAVAGAGGVVDAAAELTRQIRAAVESGNASAAMEILNVATPLAKVLGAGLEPALVMGRHAIQLTLRRAADERHLAHYYPRAEQIDAFRQLLAASDEQPWALHYLGAGGVGKTMLLRYIASQLAIVDGRRLPTTRVDFDHISPDYPVRRPGELLASLAEELRFYGGPDQEARYGEFVGRLNGVHASLASEPPPEDPLKNVMSVAFGDVLETFLTLLVNLPKPVVFMLDTCEELARLEPAGAMLPSVEATFRILERVHDRFPGLRVVFAGRRLLARAGDTHADGQPGWEALPDALSERNKMLPREKRYLQLLPVRGFTRSEASDFFTRVAKVVPGEERLTAILDKSPDVDTPIDIRWHLPRTPAPDDIERYNPFDISLYADWIKDVPELSSDTISSGKTDPYVEMRILGRIKDESLLKMLPAAVLLRRFDIGMLEDLVGNAQERRRIFRELGGLEWIDYQHDVLQVDHNLLPRLVHYYEDTSRSAQLEFARRTVGPKLACVMSRRLDAPDPFADLTVANIDAALRLSDEISALDLWAKIDRAVTDLANWAWADSVCQYLMCEGNAAGKGRSPLGAAVRATYAAAALHGPHAQLRRSLWEEIQAEAARHPDLVGQRWLYLRATIALDQIDADLLARVKQFRDDEWRYRQLVAGLAARLDARVERDVPLFEIATFVRDPSLDPGLRAFMASLAARSPSILQDTEDEARQLIEKLSDRHTSRGYADWRVPASIKHRAWLLLLRFGTRPGDTDEFEACARSALHALVSVDAERLLARVLLLQLRAGVPRVPDLDIDRIYDPGRRPVCKAHREAPLLFVSIARVLLASGDAEAAGRLLRTVLAKATAAADQDALDAVRRMTLRLKRVMREPDALSATADLIAIEQAASPSWHGWWATQSAHDPEESGQLAREAERSLPDALRRSDGTFDPHSILDALELDLMRRAQGRESDYAGPLLEYCTETACKEDPQLMLRLRALRGEINWMPSAQNTRYFAEMAFEQAELLALRLPDRAVSLFKYADYLYETVNDTFGHFRASVCSALNAIRLGERDEARKFMRRARRAYESCRLIDEALPEWDRLEASTEFDSPWFDWLLRVARLKAEFSTKGRAEQTERVESSAFQRYGTIAQFDLLSTTRARTVASDAHDHFRPLLFASSLTFAALLISAGVLATTKFEATGFVLVQLAGMALNIAILLFLVHVVLPRRVLASLRPQLLVQERPQPGGVFFDYRLARRTTLGKPGDFTYAGHVGFAPYANVAAAMRADLRGLLVPGPTMLVVDRKLASYPWEAALSIKTRRDIRDILLGTPTFVRPGEVLPQPVAGLTQWSTLGVALVCRPELEAPLASAWRIGKVFSATNPQLDASRVFHLVGVANMGSLRPAYTTWKEMVTSIAPESTVQGLRWDAGIVVIQEEPVERIRRLEVDRKRTGDARLLAVDMFNSGIHTIVFLPALPLALAEDITSAMSYRLDATRSPNLFQLFSLVALIQRMIRRFRQPPPREGSADLQAGLDSSEFRAALVELSFEVTLFTRSPKLAVENRYYGFKT